MKVPHKGLAFMWLVARRVILTWDSFLKRGWRGPRLCYLCRENRKMIKLCLLECKICKIHIGSFLIQIPQEEDLTHTLWNIKTNRGWRARDGTSLRTTIVVVLWNFWSERNDKIFNNHTCTIRDICYKIANDILLWSSVDQTDIQN